MRWRRREWVVSRRDVSDCAMWVSRDRRSSAWKGSQTVFQSELPVHQCAVPDRGTGVASMSSSTRGKRWSLAIVRFATFKDYGTGESPRKWTTGARIQSSKLRVFCGRHLAVYCGNGSSGARLDVHRTLSGRKQCHLPERIRFRDGRIGRDCDPTGDSHDSSAWLSAFDPCSDFSASGFSSSISTGMYPCSPDGSRWRSWCCRS